jgi:hypothetical protein
VFSVESTPSLYNEKFGREQRIVKNWIEFWRWQSKVIEKKWQERKLGCEKKISYVILSDRQTVINPLSGYG